MICPHCGAELSYKGTMKVCAYCGYQEKDISLIKDYNVLIACSSGSNGPVRIEIADAGILSDIGPGESQTYKLVPGPHNIVFAAANIRNTKVLHISDDDDIVTVSASYDQENGGSLPIRIDQKDPELNKEKLPAAKSILALISMICTFTIIGAPIGIILGTIDLILSKRAGRMPNSAAQTGVILGVMIVVIYRLLTLAN